MRKSKSKKPATVTKSAFASELGISRQMIGRYVRLGMPVIGRKIDPAAARVWLAANLQRPAAADTVNGETFSQARARKESALATLRELEVAIQRREVLSLADANEYATTFSHLIRDALLAQPDRLAPILASVDDVVEVRRVLVTDVRSILEKLHKAILDAGLARASQPE